jgi:2-polyprenyl-3-methyl-5-hydroxy-6-metoxy-1,4-benzoquinol methylase
MESQEFIVSEITLDQTKVESFGGQLVDMLNSAALTLMVSIGHQTGLFDTMAGMAPSTSEAIASAANLHERYVREWLGAMTVGKIVLYDAETATYHLPPEHAALLTRAAGLDNIAAEMQFIALMGEVEQGIIHSFRNGGGVPYSQYPRFQAVMAESSATVHDVKLTNAILPLVDELLPALETGIDVLDVGCGQGHAINIMAKTFPNSRFWGYDFSEQGVAAARTEAASKGLHNAHFEAVDLSNLGEHHAYDLITAFDVIHDQAQPRTVLKTIYNALKPDGIFLMVDIKASSHLHENMDHPLAPYLYTVSTMHCMTVSLALDGEGLGTVWGKHKALELLAEAGFMGVEVREIDGDVFNNYYIARKSVN